MIDQSVINWVKDAVTTSSNDSAHDQHGIAVTLRIR